MVCDGSASLGPPTFDLSYVEIPWVTHGTDLSLLYLGLPMGLSTIPRVTHGTELSQLYLGLHMGLN